MKRITAGLIAIGISSSATLAQTPAPRRVGLVDYVKAGYAGIKRDLLAAAERMPEADYAFKPGQMLKNLVPPASERRDLGFRGQHLDCE